MPERNLLAGTAVGTGVGAELGPGSEVGPEVGATGGLGVANAARVASTMAARVGLGVKTASPGGERAYWIWARRSEIQGTNRSCTKGKLKAEIANTPIANGRMTNLRGKRLGRESGLSLTLNG
jgi:hypothetical protein